MMLQPSPPDTMTSQLTARVAIGQQVAVTRRHDRRPAEQPHLPAMGMPGELQRDARDGTRIATSGSCASRMTGASSVTFASVAPRSSTPMRGTGLNRRAGQIGELIAEPGEPEGATVLGEAHRIVLVDRDADGFERAARERALRVLPAALSRSSQ